MPARATDLLWGRRAALAFAGAVLALRAAGLVVGLVNLDECDFWLFGRMVQHGAVPYVGVADIKPPLTYAAFLAADVLTLHHRALAIPLLGIAALVATALLLGATARRWTGDPRAGWAAAWLTLAGGLCESPAVNAEILMNVAAAAALYALLRAEQEGRHRWDLLAGLAAGLATLFKLQAGILLVAFVGAAVIPRRGASPRPTDQLPGRGKEALGASDTRALADPGPLSRGAGEGRGEGWGHRLLRAVAISGGYAAPWALTAGLFAAAGAFPEFYDWVVRRNVFQISSAHTFALRNVLPSIAIGLGAPCLAWWMALRQARRAGDGFQRALVVLLALTVLPVSIGQRFYEHYFLQFVPPLAVLGAPQLVALADGWAGRGRAARAAALALALVPPLGNVAFTIGRGLAEGYPGQEPRARAIAQWISAHSDPGERVFMWGDYSAIYCLADRLPGTRYMRTAPHVGDFDPLHLPADFDFAPYRSERDIAATLADLAAARPALVVDTSPADVHRWSLFPLARVPELDRYVRERYVAVGRPAGAVVYRRRDLAGPAAARDAAAPARP